MSVSFFVYFIMYTLSNNSYFEQILYFVGSAEKYGKKDWLAPCLDIEYTILRAKTQRILDLSDCTQGKLVLNT